MAITKQQYQKAFNLLADAKKPLNTKYKVYRKMGIKDILVYVGSLEECKTYKANQLNKFPKRTYLIK